MNIVNVSPSELIPHPERPRIGSTLSTDDEKYQLIKESIRTEGILNPLKVQSKTQYLLAGHTRQRIALELGLETVPVIYYDIDDDEALFELVIDNHLRAADEKDPIKMAQTYKSIVDMVGLDHGGDRRSEIIQTDSSSGKIKHSKSTGWTLKDNLFDVVKRKSIGEIAAYFGMVRANFLRYLDLLKLIPDLQEMVTESKMGIKAG